MKDKNAGQYENDLPSNIKCHSCGKLGVEECTDFDNNDEDQIKECSSDEVCILYTWKKSSRGAVGTLVSEVVFREQGRIHILTIFSFIRYNFYIFRGCERLFQTR